MITCPACSKQNQDHYRFCLGCGAELPRGAAKPDSTPPPKIADEQTDAGGTSKPPAEPAPAPVPAEAPAAAAAPEVPAEAPKAEEAPEPAGPPGTCPECGHVNAPTNRFCATCGYRLDQVAPAAPKKPKVAEGAPAAVLIALDPEGNEIGRYTLPAGESKVGRSTGSVFGDDGFLSPEHARFVAQDGKVRITDLGSLNGTFRRLLTDQAETLQPGQRFRVGQELLQFDTLDTAKKDGEGVFHQGSIPDGVVGSVALVVGRETGQPSHPILERGLNMGRERGDVMFPEDGYVSGLHCQLSVEDGEVRVTDLGSSNGTFVQLLGDVELTNGDMLLMGQQLFRVAI